MKRFRRQNRTAPALLAVFALAGALTVLLAIRASTGKADLAIFLSSPVSPVITPTPSVAPTATVTATPTATATPTITPTPTAILTATPVVEAPRCYLPLIRATGRTRLWLPIVLQ